MNLNLKLSKKFEKNEKLIKIENQPYGMHNIGNSCYINSVI